jgi:hypothetical protein
MSAPGEPWPVKTSIGKSCDCSEIVAETGSFTEEGAAYPLSQWRCRARSARAN